MLSYLLQAQCGQWFHASLFLMISLDNSPAGASITIITVTYTHSHVHSSTRAWGPTNNTEMHFPWSLIAHTWNLPAPEPAGAWDRSPDVPDVPSLMTCQKATNQLHPALMKDSGGRTRAPSTAITAQHQLLSLQALPTSLDRMEVSFSFQQAKLKL